MDGSEVFPVMEFSDHESPPSPQYEEIVSTNPPSKTAAKRSTTLTDDFSSSDDSFQPKKSPPKKSSNNNISPAKIVPSNSHASDDSPPRIKLYPENATRSGPWVVFFRPKPNGKALKVAQIAKDLARFYSSLSEITKVRPNKLRAVVTDRKQANAIVLDQRFTIEYRVYIPASDVEIEGVITEESLNCNDIKRDGVGYFKRLPSTTVNILDCRQLGSFSFRVTFSGSALPDYVVIDKLRLPVRLFYPRPMTCEKCFTIGHTALYCANKARCPKCCGEFHENDLCPSDSPKCPYCGNSPHELSACEEYKSRGDKLKRSLKERSKRSFAEILKGASPAQQHTSQPHYTNNVFAVLPIDEEVADSANVGPPFYFTGKPRHTQMATPPIHRQTPKAAPHVGVSAKNSATDKQKQVPPGFRGVNLSPNSSALEGTSKTPIGPFLPSVTYSQSGFFKLSDIVDGIFTFFNVPDSLRSIVNTMLPIVKTLLQHLMQTWPFLSVLISIDV
jgi:hypothetical protein